MRWIKPRPWNWQPHLVHPKWRWLTADLVAMAPFWEGVGTPKVWQKNGWVVPTVGGSPAWYHTEVGVGYRSTGNEDAVSIPLANLPASFPSDAETFTVLAAFYYDDIKTSDESTIVADDVPGSGVPILLQLNSTGAVRSWTAQIQTGSTTIDAPGLHTAASNRDGTNVSLYLDGALDAGPSSKTTSAFGGTYVSLSGGATQDWFDGTLLGVFILSSVLSDNQIALWNSDPFGVLRPIEETIIPYAPAAAAGSITGTLTATLGALTSTSAAVLALDSSLTATLDAATLASTGTLALTGDVSSTLDAVATTSAGTLTLAADATPTLADVTASSTATLALDGTVSPTLGAVTTSATATLALDGVLSTTLGTIGFVGVGSGGGIVGDASPTLDAIATTSAGTLVLDGRVSSILDAVTSSSAATSALDGSVSSSLDALASTATATLVLDGSLTQTLAVLTLVSQQTATTITGDIDVTFSAAQPAIAFTAQQPTTGFTARQPEPLISVED
jgi:hypothetical protein